MIPGMDIVQIQEQQLNMYYKFEACFNVPMMTVMFVVSFRVF